MLLYCVLLFLNPVFCGIYFRNTMTPCAEPYNFLIRCSVWRKHIMKTGRESIEAKLRNKRILAGFVTRMEDEKRLHCVTFRDLSGWDVI